MLSFLCFIFNPLSLKLYVGFVQSAVLPFLRSLPKGGILHTHAIAFGDFLLANGTYDPRCYLNVGVGNSEFGNGETFSVLVLCSRLPLLR